MLGDRWGRKSAAEVAPCTCLTLSTCPHCFSCPADPVDERTVVCFEPAYPRDFVRCVGGVLLEGVGGRAVIKFGNRLLAIG